MDGIHHQFIPVFAWKKGIDFAIVFSCFRSFCCLRYSSSLLVILFNLVSLSCLFFYRSIFVLLFVLLGGEGGCTNLHVFTCIGQSATTQMTVWTLRSYYGSWKQTLFVRETLPTKSQRWTCHFSSYLIIHAFLLTDE